MALIKIIPQNTTAVKASICSSGKGNFSISVVLFFILFGGTSVTLAQGSPDRLKQTQDKTDTMKTPENWLEWGTDVRLRHESILNPYLTEADPPGYNYSFERMRIREWNTLAPYKWFAFNLRFTWEGRHYWKPASKAGWDRSEIVFDNINFKFNFQKIPATLVLGRQDIVFGEGWLVSDGTPLDGPRTTYFDAIRMTINLTKPNSVLDLVYIDQKASPTMRLPPVFSQDKPLMEQNERGVIINYSCKANQRTTYEPYFIYKHNEATLPNGDKGDIFVTGIRFEYGSANNLSYRIDGAYQFGKRRNLVMFPNQESELSAFGVNSRLTYNIQGHLHDRFWLGYAVLSGNDANSNHNHQFDPLWGRWAQYSELFPNELDRPGERSNLHRINLGHQFEPVGKFLVQTNYLAIFTYANRNSGIQGFSSNGKFKGHLFTALLKYQYNRFWSGLLLGEYFIPGNYYETPQGNQLLSSRNKTAVFLRAQIIFTFRKV